MNEIKIFENSEFGNVRTLEGANGDVLFCGADIAKALGYSNPSKALTDHCRKEGITKRYTPTNSGVQHMPFISEGNINNPDGSVRVTRTPKVTGKGQRYFINKFLGDGEEC